MSVLRNLLDELAVRSLATPGTWAAAAVYGSWIQIKGKCREVLLVPINGELDADMTIKVYEATDSSGSGAQELTRAATAQKFVNGTDEGRVGAIVVKEGQLSAGYSHVTLQITPGATDSVAAIAILGGLYAYKASNTTSDGVAFAKGNSPHA